MPRLSSVVVAAALAALALPPVPSSMAQEKPKSGGGKSGEPAAPADPIAAYAAARRPMLAQVGSRLESVASFALGNKLKQTGITLFREVLEYDPDNARARRELGFEKRGDEWVAVESKQKKLADAEDESEKGRPEYERKLKDAQKGASKLLADLGDLADKAANIEDAQELWKKSLRLDDQNALANERVGNKLVDGKWLTDRAIRHREFLKVYDAALAKAVKLQVAVTACDETTGLLEKCNLQGKRYRSKHFRIEGMLPDPAIRSTLVQLERARQLFIDLYDVPERFVDFSGDPRVYVITVNDEQRDKVIDACDEIPEKEKSFKKKFGACEVSTKLHLCRYPDEATANAECVHSATHTFGKSTFGSHAPWLYDALANTVAAALMKHRLKVCFTGQGSTAGIGLEQMDLEQAPSVLRELVLKKKDTPTAEFVMLPSDAMLPKDIAKAWSVLLYLLERDRTQTREWLLRVGQGGDGSLAKDEKILKDYFPEFPTWKALDEAWREWALDVYKGAK